MGLLLVGYGLRDSITGVGTYQYEDLQLYDVSVFMSDSMEETTKTELETYLVENENVEKYANVRMESITVQNDDG